MPATCKLWPGLLSACAEHYSARALSDSLTASSARATLCFNCVAIRSTFNIATVTAGSARVSVVFPSSARSRPCLWLQVAADAAIERQLEAQAAFRHHGRYLQGIVDQLQARKTDGQRLCASTCSSVSVLCQIV